MRHLRKDWDTIQPQPGSTSIEQDEPVFLLRAKDPSARAAIYAWAQDVADRGGDAVLVQRVFDWADEMDDWRRTNHPDKVVADTPEGMLR